MNKKGFTLVELLAVIAILAILVIIALPNVLKMFNNAKKDIFLTEAKNVYKEVANKYIMESMKGNRISSITNSKNKLDIESNDIKYNIKLNDDGSIKSFQVGNDSYCISGNYKDLSEITVDKVTDGKCEEVGPKSFSTDSWDVIVDAVKEGKTDKYNLGDTREIDMGTYGKHTLRIANKSTPDECKNSSFSQTACGFVIEFADRITDYYMNETDTNKGGWEASKMRTFVNNEIYNSLPQEIRDSIITTKVVSSHGSEESNNFVTNDKMYLLSIKEVYKSYVSSVEYDSIYNLTRVLDGYYSAYTPYKAGYWWFRTAESSTTESFQASGSQGEADVELASTVGGVSPAFRIG